MTKETIIKSTLKYLVKKQIEEGSVGFAVDNDPDHDCCWDDVLAWIEAQPTHGSTYGGVSWGGTYKEEAQPCEDCISRQAVDDAIYDYSRSCDVNYEQIMEFIDKLPPVTPRRDLAETSQDCVSREEVQDLISRWLSDYLLDETREALETINYKIGDMPPVIPQRKMGRWINKFGKEQGYDIAGIKTWYIQIMCDKCGFIKTAIEGHTGQYKYCPNCGAEMSGGGEDEG